MTARTLSEIQEEINERIKPGYGSQPGDVANLLLDMTDSSVAIAVELLEEESGGSALSVTPTGGTADTLADWLAQAIPRSVKTCDLNILYNPLIFGWGRVPEWDDEPPNGTWTAYPYRRPQPAIGTDPFATTNASKTVTMTWVGHGLVTGEFMNLQGVATFAGATVGTVTITIAAPGVFTHVAHGLAVGGRVAFTTTGNLPTGIVAGTIYVVKTVPTADTFTVAATVSGASITTSGAENGVHTVTSGPIWLTAQYVVTRVDDDTLTFLHNYAASATTTGGGAAVVADVFTDQSDIYLNKNATKYVKDTATGAVVGIQQIPKVALRSGATYLVGATLSGMSAGSVTAKFVNTNAGAGSISAATAFTANGVGATTIVAGASSTIVRFEFSADAVGELAAPLSLREVLDPVDGDTYIVATADAAGAWAGQTDKIAVYRSAAWVFLTPVPGQKVWVEDELRHRIWNGTAWTAEHPAIMANGPDVYRRLLKPPADAPSFDINTPWAYDDTQPGLMVEGWLAVWSRGGQKTSETFPLFSVRDDRPNSAGASYGIRGGGGFRRTIIQAGIDLVSLDNDTVEIRLASGLTDSHGVLIDYKSGGFNTVARIYGEPISLHPISSKAVYQGRSAEILFYDLRSSGGSSGGELQFKLVPPGAAQSAHTLAAKLAGPYNWTQNLTSLNLYFLDKANPGWVKMIAAASIGSLTSEDKILYISNPNP